jgi:hypothetical protein
MGVLTNGPSFSNNSQELAWKNIFDISVTELASHDDMSLLKAVAPEKKLSILVTELVSQAEMFPFYEGSRG